MSSGIVRTITISRQTTAAHAATPTLAAPLPGHIQISHPHPVKLSAYREEAESPTAEHVRPSVADAAAARARGVEVSRTTFDESENRDPVISQVEEMTSSGEPVVAVQEPGDTPGSSTVSVIERRDVRHSADASSIADRSSISTARTAA
jgi:hypothetical protein